MAIITPPTPPPLPKPATTHIHTSYLTTSATSIQLLIARALPVALITLSASSFARATSLSNLHFVSSSSALNRLSSASSAATSWPLGCCWRGCKLGMVHKRALLERPLSPLVVRPMCEEEESGSRSAAGERGLTVDLKESV